MGSLPPLDRSQHVHTTSARSKTRTALTCRSALLWNAAMRPTKAAINAACSIFNRRTVAVRDEGDTVSCRSNVRYQKSPLYLGCASHQIRPTHHYPFRVTESLCASSDIVDDCLLGFGYACDPRCAATRQRRRPACPTSLQIPHDGRLHIARRDQSEDHRSAVSPSARRCRALCPTLPAHAPHPPAAWRRPSPPCLRL